MASRSPRTLRLDTTAFEAILEEIAAVEGNVKRAAELALKKAAVRIANDTVVGLSPQYLPHKGYYSTEDTQRSVIHFPQVEWDGNKASVPVGFDFTAPGAGGFLISGTKVNGTPRMKPDKKLRHIYKSKRYMDEIQALMQGVAMDELEKAWEGKE